MEFRVVALRVHGRRVGFRVEQWIVRGGLGFIGFWA